MNCSDARLVVSVSSQAPGAAVRRTKTASVLASCLFCLKLATRNRRGIHSLCRKLDTAQYTVHKPQHANLAAVIRPC